MKELKEDQNKPLLRSLRYHGHILPVDQEEIVNIDRKSTDELGLPQIPNDLPTPEQIILNDQLMASPNPNLINEVSNDLARAARDGKEIPKEILERMMNDRKNAKKQ